MITNRVSVSHKWLSAVAVAVLAVIGCAQSAHAQIAPLSSTFKPKPGYVNATYVGKKHTRAVVVKTYSKKKYVKKTYGKKKVASKSWKKKHYAVGKRTRTAAYKAKRVRTAYKGRSGNRGSLMATLARVKPAGLPLNLAAAVVTVESGWRVNARGSSGERGLMQLMPATARRFGGSGNLFDPTHNMRVGTRYLHWCYRRAGGNVAATIGCYNRGPGLMWSWSKNSVTRHYVSRVHSYMRRS